MGVLGVLVFAGCSIPGPSPGADTQVAAAVTRKPSVRDTRREFYTAPPSVPHVILSQENRQCVYCHSEIRHIGERTSVPTPHAERSNCQQCHVGQVYLNRDEPLPEVATSWLGLLEPTGGWREHPAAPPTIPHRLAQRKNCNSCHSADHPDPDMRGPHPERANCMQCHVADADRQF